jgi:hypothetical protein
MKSPLGLKTLAIAAALAGCGEALAQDCTTPDRADTELAEVIRTHPGLSGDVWLDFALPD